MDDFTHLHTHTTYTTGNSILEIDVLVRRAAALGMRATAIVDSATIDGFAAFTAACREHGVAPIYGCGFYLAQGSRRAPAGRSHLVLLAKDRPGHANLRHLDARARAEGLHGQPHIDDEVLAEHHAGLVCLTGGLGGDVDKLVVAGDLERAAERCRFYRSVFGDDFYLELQDHGAERNRVACAGLIALSGALGIPAVVTQGAFYLDQGDAAACNALREAHGNKPLGGDQYYFKSSAGMRATFPDHAAAFAATAHLADELQRAGAEP